MGLVATEVSYAYFVPSHRLHGEAVVQQADVCTITSSRWSKELSSDRCSSNAAAAIFARICDHLTANNHLRPCPSPARYRIIYCQVCLSSSDVN